MQENEILKRIHGRELVMWGMGATCQKLTKSLASQGVYVKKYIDRKYSSAGGGVILKESLLGARDRRFVIVGIANYFPEVEQYLQDAGYREGEDYLYWYKPVVLKGECKDYEDARGNRIVGELGRAEVHFGGSGNVIEVGERFRAEGAEIRLLFQSDGCRFVIGDDVRFEPGTYLIYINDHSTISLGDSVSLKDGTMLNASIESTVTIGKHSCFGERLVCSSVFHGSVKIGAELMGSYQVNIVNNDGHTIYDVHTGVLLNGGKDIVIENHVWLGSYTTVLSGSCIGSGSIIGANSVVTGSHPVPNNCIAVGSPARVVREDVVWDQNTYDLNLLRKKPYWRETQR